MSLSPSVVNKNFLTHLFNEGVPQIEEREKFIRRFSFDFNYIQSHRFSCILANFNASLKGKKPIPLWVQEDAELLKMFNSVSAQIKKIYSEARGPAMMVDYLECLYEKEIHTRHWKDFNIQFREDYGYPDASESRLQRFRTQLRAGNFYKWIFDDAELLDKAREVSKKLQEMNGKTDESMDENKKTPKSGKRKTDSGEVVEKKIAKKQGESSKDNSSTLHLEEKKDEPKRQKDGEAARKKSAENQGAKPNESGNLEAEEFMTQPKMKSRDAFRENPTKKQEAKKEIGILETEKPEVERTQEEADMNQKEDGNAQPKKKSSRSSIRQDETPKNPRKGSIEPENIQKKTQWVDQDDDDNNTARVIRRSRTAQKRSAPLVNEEEGQPIEELQGETTPIQRSVCNREPSLRRRASTNEDTEERSKKLNEALQAALDRSTQLEKQLEISESLVKSLQQTVESKEEIISIMKRFYFPAAIIGHVPAAPPQLTPPIRNEERSNNGTQDFILAQVKQEPCQDEDVVPLF